MSSVESRLKQVVAETFHIPVESVSRDTTSSDVRGWDSIGQLDLVMAVQMEFGFELSPEDIMQIDSVESILKLLQANGIS